MEGPLAAPAALVGTSRSGNLLRLAFTDESVGETDFVIEVAAAGTDRFTQLGSVPAPDSGGTGARVFYERHFGSGLWDFRARAVNGAETSEPSNVVRLRLRSDPPILAPITYVYDERFFTGVPVVSNDFYASEAIYGAGSPDLRIDPDTFSVETAGYYTAEHSERYTFYTASSDGIALRVVDPRDNRVLVDFDNLAAVRNLPESGYQDVAGSADLEQGVQYLVEVRFSENTGEAGFRVGWSSFSTPLERLPPELYFPLAPGGPKVLDVFLSGTSWSESFRNQLQVTGLGTRELGFRLPHGPGQLDDIPWSTVDQVTLVFDRSVTVQRGALRVGGVKTATYASSEFTSSGQAATWTLDRPLGADRVSLELDDEGVTGTRDGGRHLDGEWVDGTTAERSGNGVEGGDFRYRINALPGDVNRDGSVNAIDLGQVRARQLSSTTSGPYSLTHDVNGDGKINAVDLSQVRARQLTHLPDGEPTAPPVPATLARASATKDLFSSALVLL